MAIAAEHKTVNERLALNPPNQAWRNTKTQFRQTSLNCKKGCGPSKRQSFNGDCAASGRCSSPASSCKPPSRSSWKARPRTAPYEIAVHWADLESSGELLQFKEKSIAPQFLGQFFGEGLGYQVKTASPDDWQMEYEFYVKDVGPADAALGQFPRSSLPLAVVELKGAMTDLDRDRVSGRTAVQQCWDYLNAMPDLPLGNRLQFSHDPLVPPRKGDPFLRGIRPPGTAEPGAVRPVLLHLRARRAAPLADRPSTRGPLNCCTRRPIARKAPATNYTGSINGGGWN